jgi:hypothetical protein
VVAVDDNVGLSNHHSENLIRLLLHWFYQDVFL